MMVERKFITFRNKLVDAYVQNVHVCSAGSITNEVSELDLFYDWRFNTNQFVLAPNLLRLMARVSFL
jgi:hypothetical protein